jgi:hypothetical protein
MGESVLRVCFESRLGESGEWTVGSPQSRLSLPRGIGGEQKPGCHNSAGDGSGLEGFVRGGCLRPTVRAGAGRI